MINEPAHGRRLGGVIHTLRAAGVVPDVADVLARSADETVANLYDMVTGEVAAYSASGNPDVLPELKAHLADHTAEVRRLLAGEAPGDYGFVRAHAERRASQKFPLDAVLQAYRCMHRVFSVWVRDAALSVADSDAHVRRVVASATDFTIEYTGAVGTVITATYVQETRLISVAEGDRRTELLNTLLGGYDESDQRAARLLRRAGYLQQRQSYCVVVAQSVDPGEMERAPRTQRIVDAIAKELANLPIRVIAGVRDNLVTVVVSGTRRLSGWTAPRAKLAGQIEAELLRLGPTVLVGISADQPSTSHIPKALDEARIAFEFASVTDRVVSFSNLPIRRLLVHLGGDLVKSALPGWTDAFLEADAKSKGKLVRTLEAFAEADMNVLKAARILDVHPNTIYSRMGRIEAVTGLDGQRFESLNELLLAAELAGTDA